MYKNILLPTDGSDLSKTAIKQGIAFAKAIGAKVTAFHARPHADYDFYIGLSRAEIGDMEGQDARLDQAASKILAEVEDEAKKAGVPCTCVKVVSNSPYEVIIKAAKDNGCDLIFMASHGRRGIGLILGSETYKVLTHCEIPTLVTR